MVYLHPAMIYVSCSQQDKEVQMSFPAIPNLVWLHLISPARDLLTTEQKYFAFFPLPSALGPSSKLFYVVLAAQRASRQTETAHCKIHPVRGILLALGS